MRWSSSWETAALTTTLGARMIEIRMTGSTVTFDGQQVTIDRHRPTRYLGAGRKTIPIGHISGIRWKPARWYAVGHLRFTITGTLEGRGRVPEKEVFRDENALTFKPAKQAEYAVLRKAVEAAIAGGAREVQAVPGSVADELAKLAALVQSGAITRAEFEQAKARLLRG